MFTSAEPSAIHARDLVVHLCSVQIARQLIRAWHSRLPHTQASPWQYAFAASYDGVVYAVALWHNPSARTLPSHWLELRRMACAPDAPKNTASRFLALMVDWFRHNAPTRERCISYQDESVHRGTIYKAAGWTVGARQVARKRDRSKPRRGTDRPYRTSANGSAVDCAAKTRWEKSL